MKCAFKGIFGLININDNINLKNDKYNLRITLERCTLKHECDFIIKIL